MPTSQAHRVEDIDLTARLVRVNSFSASLLDGSGKPMGVPLVFTPATFDAEDLFEMRQWQVQPEVSFVVALDGIHVPPTARAHIQQLAQELSSCGSQSLEVAANSSEDRLQALAILRDAGVAEQVDRNPQFTAWRLTPTGKVALKTCHQLGAPKLVRASRPDVALEDMTTFELLQKMNDAGFFQSRNSSAMANVVT